MVKTSRVLHGPCGLAKLCCLFPPRPQQAGCSRPQVADLRVKAGSLDTSGAAHPLTSPLGWRFPAGKKKLALTFDALRIHAATPPPLSHFAPTLLLTSQPGLPSLCHTCSWEHSILFILGCTRSTLCPPQIPPGSGLTSKMLPGGLLGYWLTPCPTPYPKIPNRHQFISTP